jgi:uncharacterized membrane protein (DUF485 family)
MEVSMSTPIDRKAPSGADWEIAQRSEDFGRLRRAVRGFVFPMAIGFLVWYFVFVLLADYAHGFMGTKIWGNFTVGLLLGLLQFVSTFVIAIVYSNYANRKIDPLADDLHTDIVGEQR